MRFDEMRSIGHNIADSLASGYSRLIGMYELNVFGEAASSPDRFIEVDFLAGTTTGGPISPTLSEAVGRLRQALPGLCAKHGVPDTAFRRLTAHYSGSGFSAAVVVTVESSDGRVATDAYVGIPGARPRSVDKLGRIRTLKGRVQRVSR